MSQLDYGKQCAPQLLMILNNALTLHGYDAEVFRPVLIDNAYKNLDEADYDANSVSSLGAIKVLTSQPIQGVTFSDFISLSDVTSEVMVTTTAKLNVNDQLVITTPENRTFNLRILAPVTVSALGTVAFRFKAVMI